MKTAYYDAIIRNRDLPITHKLTHLHAWKRDADIRYVELHLASSIVIDIV